MKTKKLFLFIVAGISMLVISLNSCKKDRVPQDDYQDMDSFYSDNEEEEQEITVDSGSGPCDIVAKKGTHFCVTRDMLRDANGNDIPDYPFQIKVVELYSIKDMILSRRPSTSGTNILETSAEIKMRPFKNGNEAFLKSGRTYWMQTAALPSTVNNMNVYYGITSSSTNDWTIATDTLSTAVNSATTYDVTPSQTGYVSAAKVHSSTASYTPITFTVAGSNTQNIQIFISFTSCKSVMRVSNLVSAPIPVGETVTFIAFAKKQTNDFVMEQQTITVASGQTINLNMQVVTEPALLAALAAL